jgi:hypothetical protein
MYECHGYKNTAIFHTFVKIMLPLCSDSLVKTVAAQVSVLKFDLATVSVAGPYNVE